MLLSMRYRSRALTRHRGGDDCSGLFRRFDKVRIGKVGVACRGAMPVAVMACPVAQGDALPPVHSRFAVL